MGLILRTPSLPNSFNPSQLHKGQSEPIVVVVVVVGDPINAILIFEVSLKMAHNTSQYNLFRCFLSMAQENTF